MIKNIVFDLGNVLISFKPAEYFDRNGYTSEYKDFLINTIFRSREWQLIDKGELTKGEAIQKISERSSLNPQEIEAVFNLRTKILYPIAGNIKILPGLRKRGFSLYYLSNFPDDIFDEVFESYPFFKFFNGGFISARVNTAKPERKIFEILLEKYSLKAEECLFIDDDELNVRTARSIGMSGIHLPSAVDLPELVRKRLPPD
jgi:putative hydrolase of the HAD superfamily